MHDALLMGDNGEILPSERRRRLEELGLAKFEDGQITYEHAAFTDNLTDPEEQVRADLYLDLIERYGYSPGRIEMEKYQKIGHPNKKSAAKIDVLVARDDGKPFMVAELKAPADYEAYMGTSIKTQLFNVAAVENQGKNSIEYLVYHTRSYIDGELQEKTVCIDYSKHSSFEDWDEAGRPNLRSIPEDYGTIPAPQFVKGGNPDLRTNVGRDELQRIRKDLHNILWGGGKYQNELFFNLVGLFLVKIYDEKETVEGEPYKFQVSLRDGELEPAQNVYDRMNGIYFRALSEYLGYDDEQLRKVKDLVFDPQKVRYVVEVLQGISFTVNEFDVIGDFFEGIVRGEFKQSKGQYLTHTNLVRFMVQGLQLGDLALELVNEAKRLPHIIDPSCGSAAFLIESMKHITTHVLTNKDKVLKSAAVQEFLRSSFPEYRLNAWAREFIYGTEINGDLAVATKVNMVGHGDGSANIEAKDALVPFTDFSLGQLQVNRFNGVYPKPVNEQFDVVLSNPPFSVTVDRDTARKFPASYIRGETIAKSLGQGGESEVATELLFIERYYQLLRPQGRLAVVLPESVFDTSSTRDVRLFLFKYFSIKGIVSLPIEAFAPYTTTKTNILFAEKKPESEVRQWDQAWTSYSERYRRLKNRINGYIGSPRLYKVVLEILTTFEERLAMDVGDTRETIVHEVLSHASANRKAGNLTESVRELIVRYFEGGDQEQKERLNQIIRRKRSLAPALTEYIERFQSAEELSELLETLLGDLFDPSHVGLTIEALVKEYKEELQYAAEEWWVFRQVAAELPAYNMVLAEADEIGYKRGVRGEDNRPNELYSTDGDAITVDTENPASILDHLLANVQWSAPVR